jgi:uncharacterized protein (DUF58 family)
MKTQTIPDHIFKKIRKVRITTSRLATNVFAGEYKSVFKGRGLEFEEVREYQIGDDLRLIDWNVTAREGKPFIKRYVEERELTVMFLMDVSGSGYFGTVNSLKKDLAAEVCSLLAASAINNNDRVGLILFSDRIEKFIPPRKGTKHIMRLIRDILYLEPEGTGTDIPMCLEYMNKVTSRSTIAFLISDFYDTDLKKPLSISIKRHDLIAVSIYDPKDLSIPDVGLLGLTDPETNRSYLVDTSQRSIRDKYIKSAINRKEALKNMFYSIKMDFIELNTAEPYLNNLKQFFERRKLKRGQ